MQPRLLLATHQRRSLCGKVIQFFCLYNADPKQAMEKPEELLSDVEDWVKKVWKGAKL